MTQRLYEPVPEDYAEMAEAFRQQEIAETEPQIEWRYCTVEGRWRNMEWAYDAWQCDGCEAIAEATNRQRR